MCRESLAGLSIRPLAVRHFGGGTNINAAHPRAERERAVSGRQPVAPHGDGDQRPGARRQPDHHRRSVRGEREQLGGYFLIDAKDLDEAISIAARIPGARLGTVEIRPVMEIPGLPTV